MTRRRKSSRRKTSTHPPAIRQKSPGAAPDPGTAEVGARRTGWIHVGVLVVLCVVSRLPQLTSPNLFLDSDEAVVGLMAKHIVEGKALPVYFYGQAYGFSLVEALAGAAGFAIAGISDIALKVSILLVWSAGIVFFYLTVRLFTRNAWVALGGALLLVMAPAWAVWSMKARGGYVTAFTAAAFVTYLLVNEKARTRRLGWLLAGLGSALVYEAQAMWIPGLVPLVAMAVVKAGRKRWWFLGIFAAGVAAFWLPARLAAPADVVWNPRLVGGFMPEHLKFLPEYVFVNLSGAYYMHIPMEATAAARIFAGLFIAAMVIAAAFQLYLLVRRRPDPLGTALLASIGLTFFYVFFLFGFGPRYLLPLAGSAALLLMVLLARLPRWPALATAAVFALVGVHAQYGYKDFDTEPQMLVQTGGGYEKLAGSHRLKMESLLEFLDRHRVRHAFSTHWFIPWQINFYSQERIVCRGKESIGRVQDYIDRVDGALARGERLAVVGYAGGQLHNAPNTTVIDMKYVVLFGPDRRFLERIGFAFR